MSKRWNYILYRDLIVQWISYKERSVLTCKDLWLMAHKRMCSNDAFCCVLVDIILHAGTPCIQPYCICHYIPREDKLHFYRVVYKQ